MGAIMSPRLLLKYLALIMRVWTLFIEEYLVGGVLCLDVAFCAVAAHGFRQTGGSVAVVVAWGAAALVHLYIWRQYLRSKKGNKERDETITSLRHQLAALCTAYQADISGRDHQLQHERSKNRELATTLQWVDDELAWTQFYLASARTVNGALQRALSELLDKLQLKVVDYDVLLNLWNSNLGYIAQLSNNNAVLLKSWRSSRARLVATNTALVSTTACLQLTSAQLADTQAESRQVRSQLQDTSAQLQDTSAQLSLVQADRDDVRSQLQQLQAAQEQQQTQAVEEVFVELSDELVAQEDATPTAQDTQLLLAPSAEPQQQQQQQQEQQQQQHATPTAQDTELLLAAVSAEPQQQQQQQQQQQDTPTALLLGLIADDAHAAGATDQHAQVSSKQQQQQQLGQPLAAQGSMQDLQFSSKSKDCGWEEQSPPLLVVPMQQHKDSKQLEVASCSSSGFQLPGVQLLVQHVLLLQAHRQLRGQYVGLRAGFGCLLHQLHATLADKQAAETQLQLQAAAAELVSTLQQRISDMAAALQDERSTSLHRAEQIQLLQDQVQELQALVPEVELDDVMAAGNLAAVQYMFLC